MKKFNTIVFAFTSLITISGCNFSGDLEIENAELRDSINLLINRLENSNEGYQFKEVRAMAIPLDTNFERGKANLFSLELRAENLIHKGQIYPTEYRFHSTNGSQLDLVNEYDMNFLKYLPNEIGLDTITITYYFGDGKFSFGGEGSSQTGFAWQTYVNVK